MIKFRQSIGFRLLVSSFILLALPLLVDSFILVQKRYRHAIADAQANLTEVAYLKEFPLVQLNPLNKPLADIFIDYLRLERSFPTEPNEELNQRLKNLAQVGGFHTILLVKITPDNRYTVVASGVPKYIGQNYTDFFLKVNDLYTPEAIQKGYSSFLNLGDTNPFFFLAKAIYSMQEGRYVGVIMITNDIFPKIQALMQPDVNDYTINFALLFPSTIIFGASDPDLRFQYLLPLQPETINFLLEVEPTIAQKLPSRPLPVNNTIGFPFFEFTWKGQQQIGYLKRVPNTYYSLLTYTSKRSIFQKPLLEFFNIYAVYGIILLVGGSAATIITIQMIKPIQKLGTVMHKLQSGEISLRYQRDPLGFEINVLGEIFNDMIDALLVQKHVAEEARIKRETFARELRLGQQVQRSLLPQVPHYPGVEVAEMYIPTLEVGGDFYDVFIKDDSENPKLVLAIADVSGKGVQACFYSLSIKNMLRIYAKECTDIAKAMEATNELFRLDTADSGIFVTVLCGIYDHQTKTLSYYSCGHNPGLILRQDGNVEVLANTGMAMGVFSFQNAKANTVKLHPGDTVVFYTDGVTEAHNEQYQLFTEQRLIECIKNTSGETAAQIVSDIVDQVNNFAGAAEQHDDITLLVMKVKPGP